MVPPVEVSFYLGSRSAALITIPTIWEKTPNAESFFLSPTDPNEIGKIIRSFRSKQSTGQDEISMKLLKQLQASCSLPLSILVNMSLRQGVVPDAMKLAKVTPIYKAKSKESLNNYRPISLLSNISKILEKVMHKKGYVHS